jgi:ABC-type uncharacterized transport system permease subunit
MQLIATIAFTLGVIAYSVASTLFFMDLVRREGNSVAEKWAPRALALGAAAQGTHVVVSSFILRVCPVESIHFVLSLAALVAVLAYSWLRAKRGLGALGICVAPVALTFLVAAQFVGDTMPPTGLSRTLLALHVTSNLIGIGFVMLAGGASAFYLVQNHRLKAKRVPLSQGRLPALDALDLAQHRLLLIGFPLLTFGVVSGALFFTRLGPLGSASFARAVLGYATWTVVAAVLILRATLGWRGRLAAFGTLAGVALLTLVLVIYAMRPLLGGGA